MLEWLRRIALRVGRRGVLAARVYGGPHRRWSLQLLHRGCNSAKDKKITAEALELAALTTWRSV